MRSTANAAAVVIIVAVLSGCLLKLQPNEIGRIAAITSLPISLAAIALILSMIDKGKA